MIKEEFFLDILKKYQTISIIGTAKNVGKTTTLNYLIKIARNRFKLGLTSIGRDGESKDVIYSSPKPLIFVEKDTIIATAKSCLSNCDITKEIIATTDYNTPLGKIVIVRALSDGFVELAGPSINTELNEIKDILLKLNCDTVLIDGAINRKSSTSPILTDATIIATGAALSPNILKVVDQTSHLINLLSINDEQDPKIIDLSKKIIEKGTVGFIQNYRIKKIIENFNAIKALKHIDKDLLANSQIIMVKGLITDKFLSELLSYNEYYDRIELLVEDPTKLFVSKEVLNNFYKSGGILKVLYPIKIVCVTINPTSPNGKNFDSEIFLKSIEQKNNIPVFNILEKSPTNNAKMGGK